MLKRLSAILFAFLFIVPVVFAASAAAPASNPLKTDNAFNSETSSARNISRAISSEVYTDYGKKIPEVCKGTVNGIALAAAYANTKNSASISAVRPDISSAAGFNVSFSTCKTCCVSDFNDKRGNFTEQTIKFAARKAVSFITGYLGLLRLLGSESLSAAKYLYV